MSHDPSRKHFFAKVLGFTAAIGLVPRLWAKLTAVTTPDATLTTPLITVRSDSRAVARRPETV